MRFEELNRPQVGDILEIEVNDEIVETVIVGIAEDGSFVCETDNAQGITILEASYGQWKRMDAYDRDYEHSIAGMGGRRHREDDEHHEIDARLAQQAAQQAEYVKSGKWWLKYKDSQKHISDQAYVGKAAANAAALELLRQHPELKGNVLLTATGPMGEAIDFSEKKAIKGMRELPGDQYIGLYKFGKNVAGHDGEKQTAPEVDNEIKDKGFSYAYTDVEADMIDGASGGKATNVTSDDSEEDDDVNTKSPLGEAEFNGKKVKLGKPSQGDVKKFKVFVRNPKTGRVIKVNFGDPDMRIRKSNPKARKSFRARHNCDNPGPRTKARYWSCRKW